MKLLNFAIIKLTICLALGISMGYLTHISLKASILFTGFLFLILCVAFVITRKKFIQSVWFGISVFLTMLSVGVLTTNIHNHKNFSNHYTTSVSIKNDSLKTIAFKIREVLKSNTYYDKYIVDILQVENKNTSGKTVLNVQKDSLQNPLKFDAVYITKTDFKIIPEPLNPHQFNYKNYLERQYIYHQLSIKNELLLAVEHKPVTLFGIANNIRDHINKKLKPYQFKPDELAIINALLLGQRQNISKTIYTNYANAGVIHILAVSGLHVGIILWILNFIFKPIDRVKHGMLLKTILLVSMMWGFALIAGFSASVTRAVTMFSIVTIASNIKRPTNIYNTLAISMFVILLYKPLFLFDVGFQLSYLAVISIVTIDPYLHKLWTPKFWVTKKLWQPFTVTVSAQFGIIPLSLFYFHQFPSLFFISNLIIIPFLGYILGIGIVVIILSVLNILPQFIADSYGFIISLMNRFVSIISKQETFLLDNISFSLLYLITFYLLIITLVRLLLKQNYFNLKLFLIAILFVQSSFIYTQWSNPSNTFTVFHKNGNSLLGNTNNNKLVISHDLDSITKNNNNNSIITDYAVGNHVKTINEAPISNIYQLNKKRLLIVDSLGIYQVKHFNPDYVLLRQSPKINLNRLIDSLNPKYIIADGSNYKSSIRHWANICKKRKLSFHQTSKKGAFVIRY